MRKRGGEMDEKVLAERLGEVLGQREWSLATAESCTGGWVAQAVTAIAGSSQWFERGFVTYSNAAKVEMLGVRAETIDRRGAVQSCAGCAGRERHCGPRRRQSGKTGGDGVAGVGRRRGAHARRAHAIYRRPRGHPRTGGDYGIAGYAGFIE